MKDKYTGDPPELSDVPVFPAVQFSWLDTDKGSVAWPSWDNQEINARGSIWDFCADAAGPIWAEFGVKLGTSARYLLKKLPEDGKFYLFDSFEGIPEEWNSNPKGHFNVKASPFDIPTFEDLRVEVVEGWFEDTLPIDATLDFVHVDSDLYSSAKTVLERINVHPGTIILFDELFGYTGWEEGEYKALMEWDREYKFIARDRYQRAAIEII